MIIKRACEAYRNEMSQIFVDGFYQWLKYFSKNKTKLNKTFAHMFQTDVFYIAVIDNQIAAIAACSTNTIPSVRLKYSPFVKHLGFLMGSITYVILKKEFENKQYPFQFPENMGAIEFVATSINYRGQGVATKLLQSIINSTSYNEYVLEVADTNTYAIKLYKKLGFIEFMRIPQKHGARSDVHNLVYMKYLTLSG